MGNRLYLGIDTGATGGIAILGEDGTIQALLPFKKHSWAEIIVEMVRFREDIKASILENVTSSRRENGVQNAFKQGVNIGIIKGILLGLGIPFEEVLPAKWQKGYQIPKGITYAERKKVMHNIASGLYPTDKVTKDMADALLIARYCYQENH
jgi:hypothetical protein